MLNFLNYTISFVKIYTHPKMLAVLLLGLASGLPLALTLSTLTVWMSEAGVSKSAIGLFAAVGTPYALKFLWSPLVDNTPLLWLTKRFGRRRGWLFLTQTFLIISIIGLGSTHPAENAWITALWALMVATASATQDIILDAYRIEILEDEQQGAGAATFVFGYRIGMLLSGAGALFLASYTSWFFTYSTMALLILLGTVTVLITGEPGLPKPKINLKNFTHWITHSVFDSLSKFIQYPFWQMISLLLSKIRIIITRKPKSLTLQPKLKIYTHWLKHSVADPFIEFMQRPFWWMVLLFVLLYKFGDAFAGIMTNPFLIEMGFDKTEIATVVKTYGLFATIIGTFIGGAIASRMPILAALLLCGILQMSSNLLFLWQLYAGHDTMVLAVVISIENLAGGMGTAAFVAYISRLCNKEFTATQYALLSSLSAVGRTLLSTSSGITVDMFGWANFFIISTVIALPGLALLILLERKLKLK